MPGRSKRPGKPETRPDGTTKPGRPPMLTPEVHTQIIEAVELLGMAEGRAGLVYGIDDSTISIWKKRGREALAKWDDLTPDQQVEERRYLEFFKALRDAEPKFEFANLAIIQKAAASGDWRAADRRLAQKFPERHGKRILMGNDPRNPMPAPVANPGIPTVLILPSNGRQDPYLQPPAPPAGKADAKAPARPGKGKRTKPKAAEPPKAAKA